MTDLNLQRLTGAVAVLLDIRLALAWAVAGLLLMTAPKRHAGCVNLGSSSTLLA